MKYYYLISSLPDLEIDDTSLSQEQLKDILDLIYRNLSEEDTREFECLLYPQDNQNLLYVLFHEYHDFEIRDFHQPAVLPVDALQNYRREMASLPDYMIHYIRDQAGSFPGLSLRRMEEWLEAYFYDHLLKSESLFVQTYFSWKHQLEEAVAEVNLKAFPFMQSRSERNVPFFPHVRSLHSLTEPSEIMNQIMPLASAHNLEAIEAKINAYYWEFANAWRNPFSKEQVLAYAVKLLRLYRWKGFAAKGELAKAKFESLIHEMKQRTSSPKMPLL
jgi:hypothetical protein